MEVGTIFRIDHPVREDGFWISIAKPEDYPLYGIIHHKRSETAFRAVMYIYRDNGWMPVFWNWKLRHIETFEEVPV